MIKFLSGFAIILVAIIAFMFLGYDENAEPAAMPWDIIIMPDGNPSVFGIHLGTTTYRETQENFHEYGKTAIFTESDKPSSVEAFFSSVHLGGLDAKVVLNLAVDEQAILGMLDRALESKIQPSGARRYELSNEDNRQLIDEKVISLTYIPSLRLTKEMVAFRFGKPDMIEQDSDSQSILWLYPKLGLNVTFKEGEKPLLQYQTITL
jgi:hypothetical protein